MTISFSIYLLFSHTDCLFFFLLYFVFFFSYNYNFVVLFLIKNSVFLLVKRQPDTSSLLIQPARLNEFTPKPASKAARRTNKRYRCR